jgi:hypothetical protein
MSRHANMPCQRRGNLLRRMCFNYLREFEPEVFRRLRVVAEVEIPVQKGGRYKNKRVNVASA